MRPTDKQLALVGFGIVIFILVLELLSDNPVSSSDVLAVLILGISILIFMKLGYALRASMFASFDEEFIAQKTNMDQGLKHTTNPKSSIAWLTMEALVIPNLVGIIMALLFNEPLLFVLGLSIGIAGATIAGLVWRKTAQRNNH